MAALVVVLLALAGLAAGGWYYSERLRSGALEPDREKDEFDLQVVAMEDGSVTLRSARGPGTSGDWKSDGTFGLEWEQGYGQVGAVLEMDNEQVARSFVPLRGTLKVGDLVRLDSFAFPGDPRQAHGMPFREVTFASELGELSAWFVEGEGDVWVILVHGRGADRREALRILPALVERGFPALVITYRNDVGAPRSPDGFYHFGHTEWKDLEAAANFAVRQGAERLVLVGYSMGGAIVTNFLYQSPLADRVEAVVLDAPMLDFNAVLNREAQEMGVPGILTEAGKATARFRFGFDPGELNYLKRADELDAPILLFHGDADPTVPVGTSDALAEARPDIVTYVRVPGAGHVRSWNAGPAAYEEAVRKFLGRLDR